MCVKTIFVLKKKLEKLNLFFPGKKVERKNAQLFSTIFLMKVMKKSPVMKLICYVTHDRAATHPVRHLLPAAPELRQL